MMTHIFTTCAVVVGQYQSNLRVRIETENADNSLHTEIQTTLDDKDFQFIALEGEWQMKQKQWIRITEDTFDFSEGEIYIAERREDDGVIISDPNNPFNID